jgi:hypothetical protein
MLGPSPRWGPGSWRLVWPGGLRAQAAVGPRGNCWQAKPQAGDRLGRAPQAKPRAAGLAEPREKKGLRAKLKKKRNLFFFRSNFYMNSMNI